VLFAAEQDRELNELTLEEFREFSDSIEDDVFAALDLQSAIGSKSQAGGTSPARVADALKTARQYLDDLREEDHPVSQNG
jgi:argininosuccinate lyase